MLTLEQVEYGSDEKYGSADGGRFGFGQLVGVVSSRLPEEAKLTRAIRLGWAHGCPTARTVIDTYGADWIMRRYSTCNYMLSRVTKEAERLNGPLYKLLATPTSRLLPEEEVGTHEPVSVPESHKKVISPMSGLHGYAAPRLLLLRRDTNADIDGKTSDRADAFIKWNLQEAHSLNELLAGIARDISNEPDLERIDVLSHLLPQGILGEEHCFTTYKEFAQQLIKTAPDLVRFYQELTPSQKAEKGIADLSDFK